MAENQGDDTPSTPALGTDPNKNSSIDGLSSEQKNEYIAKLKDENAGRRVLIKKREEEYKELAKKQQATESELQKLRGYEDELTNLRETVQKIEKEKKEADLKEKTEIERLNIMLQDQTEAQKKLETDYQAKLQEAAAITTQQKMVLENTKRENLIAQMAANLDFKFSSEFEQSGFMAEVTKRGDQGEFILDEDAITEKITELGKSKKLENIPSMPGATPKGKMPQPQIDVEMKNMIDDNVPWDPKKFDELFRAGKIT